MVGRSRTSPPSSAKATSHMPWMRSGILRGGHTSMRVVHFSQYRSWMFRVRLRMTLRGMSVDRGSLSSTGVEAVMLVEPVQMFGSGDGPVEGPSRS